MWYCYTTSDFLYVYKYAAEFTAEKPSYPPVCASVPLDLPTEMEYSYQGFQWPFTKRRENVDDDYSMFALNCSHYNSFTNVELSLKLKKSSFKFCLTKKFFDTKRANGSVSSERESRQISGVLCNPTSQHHVQTTARSCFCKHCPRVLQIEVYRTDLI